MVFTAEETRHDRAPRFKREDRDLEPQEGKLDAKGMERCSGMQIIDRMKEDGTIMYCAPTGNPPCVRMKPPLMDQGALEAWKSWLTLNKSAQ